MSQPAKFQRKKPGPIARRSARVVPRHPILFVAALGTLFSCLAPAQVRFIETEHAHVNVSASGSALVIDAESDSASGSVRESLDGVAFVLNSLTRLNLSPSLPQAFQFLGVPGTQIWRLSTTPQAGRLYFGFSSYGLPLAAGLVDLELSEYVGPGGETFTYDSIGGVPTVHHDTRLPGPYGNFRMTGGTHFHPFVVLQQRGIHRMTYRARQVVAGGFSDSAPTSALFLVEPTGWERWLVWHFGSRAVDAIAGPAVDADGDGLFNLMEYALGGDPEVADAMRIAPGVGVSGSSPDRRLSFSFRSPNDAFGARSDLRVRVEASGNLVDWTELPSATHEIDGGLDTDGTPVRRFLDSEVIDNNRRFLRLSVDFQ